MRDDQAEKQIYARVSPKNLERALDMYWDLRNGPILPDEALSMVLQRYG